MIARSIRSSLPYAYGEALLIVALVTTLSVFLRGYFDLVNIVMLFPLAVLFAAVRLGRGPAVLAAILSVIAFDFFLVPPHFTLAISDIQYLTTFAVLLAVALTTAQLANGLRRQRDAAERRENRTRDLYEMARELSAALTTGQVGEIVERFARTSLDARAWLLVADGSGRLARAEPAATSPGGDDLAQAQRIFDQASSASPVVRREATHAARTGGRGGKGGSAPRFLPLRAAMATRGVLLVDVGDVAWHLPEEQTHLLETVATLVAISLERIHYVEVAQATQVEMASERLRSSLLAALSHDLRTPLTALVGLSESLALAGPPLADAQQEIADAIRDESRRTSSLVNNLLEMARLQSGKIHLRQEWQPLEEVVGAALQARLYLLQHHTLRLDLPADLPLVHIDAVLMERVLCNLFENAAKFTPSGGVIEVRARAEGKSIAIEVADNGPGLRSDPGAAHLGAFGRGDSGQAASAGGLGLAIVETIVQAHGGRVEAENRCGGGALFRLTLPLGVPPGLPEDAA